MNEKTLLFGKARSLVGILTRPQSTSADNGSLAAIVLNAGMLHRVGPNRLHVKMARALAEAGLTALRFDFSGIGDSPAGDDNIASHERLVVETREAMDYLDSSRNVRRFILIGICSGADIAFRTACRDDRVTGAVMINGFFLDDRQIRELASVVRDSAQERYYRGRLFNPGSWWRLVSGKSNFRSIRRLLRGKIGSMVARKAVLPPEINLGSEWLVLAERGVDLLLIYSEGSSALDTFRLTLERKISGLPATGKLRVVILQDTDHVFTLLWSQEHLVDLICQWVRSEERGRSLTAY